MPISVMPFKKAVSIFLRYYQGVLNSDDYCPENIFQSRLGHGGPPIVHAAPANLCRLIEFLVHTLADNDIRPDLETLCTDLRFPELSQNMHDMRTMGEILTPGLIDRIHREVSRLGSSTQQNQILDQCPAIFIGNLFDCLRRRGVSLPREVQEFYHALYCLSTYYISRIDRAAPGQFHDWIKRRYFK